MEPVEVRLAARAVHAVPPGEVSPVAAHLVEQGAEPVFIGLMALWCLVHFQSRRPVHDALLVLAALFSAVLWLEYAQGRRGIASPFVNSIPLAALLGTAPIRLLVPAPLRRGESGQRRVHA